MSSSNSLSKQLISSVFKIYFVMVIIVTLGHFIIESYYAKKDIMRDLENHYEIVNSGLSYAMWTLNSKAIEQFSSGLYQATEVTGVIIRDNNYAVSSAHMPKNKKSFSITRDIIYGTNQVGSITIYSDISIIFNRVKVGWMLITLNFIIKASLLYFLLVITINKLLKKPLMNFIHSIEETEQGKVSKNSVVPFNNDCYEIHKLKSAFNSLILRIVSSHKTLQELNQELEGRVSIRTSELEISNAKLKQTQSELEQLVITDPLTMIYNRRYFNDIMPKIINSAKREGKHVALAILDIDFFKQYNDLYGHQEGDKALVAVAELIKSMASRADDYAFRMGGEEFALLIKGDSPEKTLDYIHSIKEAISGLGIEHSHNKPLNVLTASFGLYIKEQDDDISQNNLYKSADDLLYKAKQTGRNKVESNITALT